mgnify:FL=1|jgi:hypothetical protein|tara:strand:+ start:1099 stop:1311 length:213 start_codon:yes stop_codon:yes gene_type:complete
MNNIFTKHPKENGHSGFFSHLFFACSIALRTAIVTCVFTIHAIFPFIPMPKFLTLEMTIQFLIKKNLDTL